MNLLLRWFAVAVAVAVTAFVVPGISVIGPDAGTRVASVLGVAAVIGVVNALIRPIVKTLSACLIVLTFGLFSLVVNALMLMLASWLARSLGFGFVVAGFWPAFIGAILISLVSTVVSGALGVRR